MKFTPVLCLCALSLLPSCSHFSEHPPKLANFSMKNLNPFRNKIPIREVNEAELAAMQDRTIAAHDTANVPDTSRRPVDFSPPGLPRGFDLLHASLLPPKSGSGHAATINADGDIPEHSPIVPLELLDELAEDSETLFPDNLAQGAPLVPDAPKTVEALSGSESDSASVKTTQEAASRDKELWGKDPFDE